MACTGVTQCAGGLLVDAVPDGEVVSALSFHRKIVVELSQHFVGDRRVSRGSAAERSMLCTEIETSAGAIPWPDTSSR